jgi:hypothetical protein
MGWLADRQFSVSSERLFSGLLRALPHAGYVIASCDRASGFIAVYRPLGWNRSDQFTNILIEPESETNSTVLVGSTERILPAFVAKFLEARQRKAVEEIFEVIASVR